MLVGEFWTSGRRLISGIRLVRRTPKPDPSARDLSAASSAGPFREARHGISIRRFMVERPRTKQLSGFVPAVLRMTFVIGERTADIVMHGV